jgi:asparagine synthase (glutamine-hydrolysing)
MCGIWGYIDYLKTADQIKLFESFMKIQNRGPDRSEFKIINESIKAFLGFHRLAIMDKTTDGDQPFTLEHRSKTRNSSIYVMCNGEIYNHTQLKEEYKIRTQSNSDCEILPYIYQEFGFQYMIKILQGEFAICVLDFDHNTNTYELYLGRDSLGVRPLFYGQDEKGIGFCSELKGLVGIVNHRSIHQLEAGTYIHFSSLQNTSHKHMYNSCLKNDKIKINKLSLEDNIILVKNSFEQSVINKLHSNRPLGALLSGGLDSSLVVSIAAKYLNKTSKKLKTFSIGIDGATDKEYAESVAEYCGTEHTHIEFTNEEFLGALTNVVKATETYDITTIRASTGQYLISKWIAENTDIKVLLIGDGSDELFGGYMYFHNAPSAKEHHDECLRLLRDIEYYDVLRADRCIAENGLEARVPFLDHIFVETILGINPEYMIPTYDEKVNKKIEKWILRKAFDDGTYLPDKVLWRKKEAFSDGVSSENKSWYEIIQESLEDKYNEEDFEKINDNSHIKIKTKEGLFYKNLFNEYFSNDLDHIIPYYWMPKWCGDIDDPSARVLESYK